MPEAENREPLQEQEAGSEDGDSPAAETSTARAPSRRGSRRAASGRKAEVAATGSPTRRTRRGSGSKAAGNASDAAAVPEEVPAAASPLPEEAATESPPPASTGPALTAESEKDAPPITAAPVTRGPGAAETSGPDPAEALPLSDQADMEGPFSFPDRDAPDADEGAEASSQPRRRKPRRSGRSRRRSQSEGQDAPEAALPSPEEDSRETMPEEAEGVDAGESPAADAAGLPSAAPGILPPASEADGLSGESPPPDEATAEEEAVAARKKGRVREKTVTESGTRLPARGLMKMLISVLPGEEVEVVLTEDNKVREYYVEMMHHARIRGNIYKGVISNIDTNLQAAFVNYGAVKNGFLQIDEVHPDYYLQPHEASRGNRYPPIQKALKAGQEVLVQVVREPNGTKGAFLTTWISLAGRFLVLTPGQEEIGISRKVEDTEERNRLRELIKGLNPGQGLGAIVRTVSAGTSKTTLQKDLSYLKRLWKDIRKRGASTKAPGLIHREPELASRALRDYLADDIAEIWVDDAETAETIRETANLLFPRKTDLVHLHEAEKETLWERFGIQKQLDRVHAREVQMPSGGRLVFDQTEALMAIDINSGRISGKSNFEAMAFRTNMEAATLIAEQLRLRDIGGQIVIDFIEMRDIEHCREVEKTLREAMRWDRARHDIGRMSSFGLLQLVRQRTGSSAISITLEPCPCCRGTGLRRNLEWQAVQTLRDLQRAMRHALGEGRPSCVCCVEPELAFYLLNHKRERLIWLEQRFGLPLEVRIRGFADAAPAAVAAQPSQPSQVSQPSQPSQNGQGSAGRGTPRSGVARSVRRERKQEKGKQPDREDMKEEEVKEEVMEAVREEETVEDTGKESTERVEDAGKENTETGEENTEGVESL